MSTKKRTVVFSVAWNLILLMAGAVVLAIGIKAIAIPHGFITGGFSGLSLLIYYVFKGLSPGIWYFVLNIPLFIAGWIFLSRRFFFYSLFGMVVLTVAIDLIPFTIPIHDKLLAALAAGALIGAGAGIYLHSFGSAGGSDIIAIILNQKLNFGIGKFYMIFNAILFSVVLSQYKPDIVIASLILTFISTFSLEQVLALFPYSCPFSL